MRIASPVRSIVDAAESGTAPERILRAVGEAIDRGLASRSRLLAAARAKGGRVERCLRRALGEARARRSTPRRPPSGGRSRDGSPISRGGTGASLVRLREDVAFEGFLARLVAAAPGRWVLDGALALELRLGPRAQTTRDMDLLLREGGEAATEAILAASAADLGDFFVFAGVWRTSRVKASVSLTGGRAWRRRGPLAPGAA